jgi:hypothetical protein
MLSFNALATFRPRPVFNGMSLVVAIAPPPKKYATRTKGGVQKLNI